MKMRLGSTRVRLTLWNIIVVSVVMLTFALVIHVGAERVLLASIDKELTLQADAMSLDFSPVLSSKIYLDTEFGDAPFGPIETFPAGGFQMLEPPEEFQPLTNIAVYLPDGRTFFDSASPPETWLDTKRQDMVGNVWPEETKSGHSVFRFEQLDDKNLRVFYRPVSNHGQIVGLVKASYDTHEMQRLLSQLKKLIVFLIPLALLAVGLVSIYLTGNALRPIADITASARNMSANDLSNRLPVRGNDEFSNLAHSFNDMFDRLEESFEKQKRFVADASHELRTPLSAIKANANWLKKRPRDSSEILESAYALESASERMENLVEKLLQVARIDSGKEPITKEPVDLRSTIEKALNELEYAKSQRQVDLLVRCGQLIHAKYEYLLRVFINVIENAFRHTDDRGHLTINSEEDEGGYRLDFIDDGEGIEPHHLPLIGQRFYRTDSSRSALNGGTGLGLAISIEIINLHKGTFAITSEPQKGTKISI